MLEAVSIAAFCVTLVATESHLQSHLEVEKSEEGSAK
jgi:hypothetical protein